MSIVVLQSRGNIWKAYRWVNFVYAIRNFWQASRDKLFRTIETNAKRSTTYFFCLPNSDVNVNKVYRICRLINKALRSARKWVNRFSFDINVSSVIRALGHKFHAASTRRAKPTRHAWIWVPMYPRGVHAACHTHAPYVDFHPTSPRVTLKSTQQTHA